MPKRLSLSHSLSFLLRPAFIVCKQFGSRRSLIPWVYSYTSREDFQSMYEPARCFNESFCKILFHAIWILITCDKGSDEPAQMCILNTAFSTQRDTHPSNTQCRPQAARQRNAIQMAVRWRAGGGPLLDVYLDKIGSRLQELSHLNQQGQGKVRVASCQLRVATCKLRVASCKLHVAKANIMSQHIFTIIFNT